MIEQTNKIPITSNHHCQLYIVAIDQKRKNYIVLVLRPELLQPKQGFPKEKIKISPMKWFGHIQKRQETTFVQRIEVLHIQGTRKRIRRP